MSVMPDEAAEAADKNRATLMQSVATLVVLTMVAAGSGTLLGFHLVSAVETAIKKKEVESKAAAPEPRYAAGTSLHKVPPIVANLAAPEDVWVRIEASIILADDEVGSPDVLAGQIAEDMLAYMRTVSLHQIEGPSGLLHLHEDLNDRVAIRSDDRVRELIIETLVVQ